MSSLLNRWVFLFFLLTALLILIFFLYVGVEGYDRLTRWWIKKKILRNPLRGNREGGDLVYQERGYEYRYRLKEVPTPDKRVTVEWISLTKRKKPLWKNLSFTLLSLPFLLYQMTLDPKSAAGILLISIVLCLSMLTPTSTKEALFSQLIAKATGIPNVRAHYEERGRLKIEGRRTTAVDGKEEPFVVDVNPFGWLMFGAPATVTRERGAPYGSVTYEVYQDALGNPTFLKEGRQVTGRREGGRIDWEETQGTGIREGKVSGHHLKAESGGERAILKDE